jgi:hypothetical protein
VGAISRWCVYAALGGALSGCSIADVVMRDRDPSDKREPEPRALMLGMGKVVAQAGLSAPFLASAPRRAHSFAPAAWVACLRGSGNAWPYAVFFRSNDYVTYRLARSRDGCDKDEYFPLGNS